MKLDNKKLVKVLVVSGTGLLILFIIIRLAFKNSGNELEAMPTIGELNYEPKKIEETSKIEQFEEQKKEADRKAMGNDNSQYVIPSFKNLSDKPVTQQSIPNSTIPTGGEQTVSIRPTTIKTQPDHIAGGYSRSANPTTTPQTTPVKPSNNSKLNYHSDYFKEEIPPAVAEAPKTDIPPSSENPFGTITTGNNEVKTSQKQVSNQASYYTGEIYGDQKIEDGGLVLIRNTIAMKYQDYSIPRNSILYGQASFRGNRVFVSINRVKTPAGEYSVSFSVKDNDRIDGLYFKAPIDESVDKTKQGINPSSIPIPGPYGKIVTTAAQSVVQNGKEIMKKSSSLNLEEGYKLYLLLN